MEVSIKCEDCGDVVTKLSDIYGCNIKCKCNRYRCNKCNRLIKGLYNDQLDIDYCKCSIPSNDYYDQLKYKKNA